MLAAAFLLFSTGAFPIFGAEASNPDGISTPAANHGTADNGNGTYSTPLFYEEFEDPDPIRVGQEYYLAGTTMHMNPGRDHHATPKTLVSLGTGRAVTVCRFRLGLGACNIALKAAETSMVREYGPPAFATTRAYSTSSASVNNAPACRSSSSKSASGPWERNQLPGRHDQSVLFDDDLGKIFLISGGRSPYPIDEMAPDLRSFVPGVQHYLTVPPGQRMGEGHHLYKINGKYYDISAMPGGPVNQMIAKADSIDGPWTVTTMVEGESLGVTSATPARARANDRGLWLHQGGMCDTPSGEWWSIIMSDHGSAGRMVSLAPISWDNGFPLIGLPGNLRKAPNTWIKPNTGQAQGPKPAFIHDDNFKGGRLNPLWQWNHVPNDSKWSLTEKPGVLRLHSLPADDLFTARNTICISGRLRTRNPS